jgi:hypothetical protein
MRMRDLAERITRSLARFRPRFIGFNSLSSRLC